jgi:hypothetical protein
MAPLACGALCTNRTWEADRCSPPAGPTVGACSTLLTVIPGSSGAVLGPVLRHGPEHVGRDGGKAAMTRPRHMAGFVTSCSSLLPIPYGRFGNTNEGRGFCTQAPLPHALSPGPYAPDDGSISPHQQRRVCVWQWKRERETPAAGASSASKHQLAVHAATCRLSPLTYGIAHLTEATYQRSDGHDA